MYTHIDRCVIVCSFIHQQHIFDWKSVRTENDEVFTTMHGMLFNITVCLGVCSVEISIDHTLHGH